MANNYWQKRTSQRLHSRDIVKPINNYISNLAFEIQNQIKRTLSEGGRTGREYPRPNNTFHTASAPGEPPITDSGQLRASVQAPKKIAHGYEIVIPTEYAIYLEYGTRNMAPRPFVERSINKAKERITWER